MSGWTRCQHRNVVDSTWLLGSRPRRWKSALAKQYIQHQPTLFGQLEQRLYADVDFGSLVYG